MRCLSRSFLILTRSSDESRIHPLALMNSRAVCQASASSATRTLSHPGSDVFRLAFSVAAVVDCPQYHVFVCSFFLIVFLNEIETWDLTRIPVLPVRAFVRRVLALAVLGRDKTCEITPDLRDASSAK